MFDSLENSIDKFFDEKVLIHRKLMVENQNVVEKYAKFVQEIKNHIENRIQ